MLHNPIYEMLEDREDHLTDQLDYRFEKERQASQIANQQLEIAPQIAWTEMRVEIHQANDSPARWDQWAFYQKSGQDRWAHAPDSRV